MLMRVSFVFSNGRSKASCGHGFSLVEALVAVVVLAIGLVALAGMQLRSLQAAQVSYFHTLASIASQDAVERLRILAAISDSGGVVACSDVNGILSPDGYFGADWESVWGGSLPGLSISDSSASDCVYTLLVEWEESRFIGPGSSSLLYHARVPDFGYKEDEEL